MAGRGPSGRAGIGLIAARQQAHAGVEFLDRGGLGEERGAEGRMKGFRARADQAAGRLHRTKGWDAGVVIGRQIQAEPHRKPLMKPVRVLAAVRQFRRNTAKVASGDADMDMIAPGVDMPHREPSMAERADRETGKHRHGDAQPQRVIRTHALRQRQRDVNGGLAAAETFELRGDLFGFQHQKRAAQEDRTLAQGILDADRRNGMALDDGPHQRCLSLRKSGRRLRTSVRSCSPWAGEMRSPSSWELR